MNRMKNIFSGMTLMLISTLLLAPADLKADQVAWGRQGISYYVQASKQVSPVVLNAIDMLREDLKQVADMEVSTRPKFKRPNAIVLQADVDDLGPWKQYAPNVLHPETFSLHVAPDPKGGVIMVVIGTDARGTAYGVLELSRLAGVSPWVWWNDATPQKRDTLFVDEYYHTEQHPTVAYRGIFINDEDWSTRPWAGKHFGAIENGQIPAAAYREVFKLLLRLRANMIWPAMHEGTVAFYQTPGAKEVADAYGIVVGTSHCEPMMRNNVGEWDVQRLGRFNYITNKAEVTRYWCQRLKEVAKYDNVYTLGMRGIHDGSMEGVKTLKEKTEALQQVINDQRRLLDSLVVPLSKHQTLTELPQVFVPYKEVLQIMENGLQVPDDVTLLWCDDNYGYLTRLPDSLQQRRLGGSGIYYHLSYWGRPHDYLWLTTTQPGLMCHELSEAIDHRATRQWIFNVHELKSAAYQLELAMDMAWNPSSIDVRHLNDHLQAWLMREYGPEAGKALCPLLLEYYRLTAIRKPEFMGWSQTELDKRVHYRGLSPVIDTEFSFTELGNEAGRYLSDYICLRTEVERIGRTLVDSTLQAAYFAHILYPVCGASYMAEKQLYTQRNRHLSTDFDCARASYAYRQIERLTRYYNDSLMGGKWNGIMSINPRDLPVFQPPFLDRKLSAEQVDSVLSAHAALPDSSLLPAEMEVKDYVSGLAVNAHVTMASGEPLTLKAGQVTGESYNSLPHVVQNLGHSQQALVLPKGAVAQFSFDAPFTDDYHLCQLMVALIPTQCMDKGDVRISIQVDNEEPIVRSIREPYRSEQWKLNVLRGQALVKHLLTLTPGQHRLSITALDDHIILDQWMVDAKPDRRFYMIPKQ